jgi:hypothetical protein
MSALSPSHETIFLTKTIAARYRDRFIKVATVVGVDILDYVSVLGAM